MHYNWHNFSIKLSYIILLVLWKNILTICTSKRAMAHGNPQNRHAALYSQCTRETWHSSNKIIIWKATSYPWWKSHCDSLKFIASEEICLESCLADFFPRKSLEKRLNGNYNRGHPHHHLHFSPGYDWAWTESPTVRPLLVDIDLLSVLRPFQSQSLSSRRCRVSQPIARTVVIIVLLVSLVRGVPGCNDCELVGFF